MTIRSLIIAITGAALVSGCAESARPVATGKGALRMLNASVTSPTIRFVLEERQLDTVNFKAVTAANRFDDLEYNVNFDYQFAGEPDISRLATVPFKMKVDTDHLFIFSGTLSAPATFVWERPIRAWDGSETVFEVEFGHVAAAQGQMDIYFTTPGEALGSPRATLTNGNKSSIVELPLGEYIVTVTSAGNPGDIRFQGTALNYSQPATYTITLLDGDRSIPSPFSVSILTAAGTSQELENTLAPQTLRTYHGSLGLPAYDFYADSDFNTPLHLNIPFASISAEAPVSASSTAYTFTETGNVGTLLHQESFGAPTGRKVTRFLVGRQPNLSTHSVIDDKRSREDIARLRFYQAAFNHTFVDIYLVNRDVGIGSNFALFFNQLFTTVTNYTDLRPGTYDLYVTVANDRGSVLAGPVALDIAAGDVVHYSINDTADPNVVDLNKYEHLTVSDP